MKRLVICLILLNFASLCLICQPLTTVEKVDLDKYAGRWYSIASYPASFEKGCRCTTADYELIPGKGYIRVVNRCVRFKGGRSKISIARARAFIVPGSENTRLKVQFFWPFRGDYYIIGLADDYSWALVGTPSRKYLWILSRESFMSTETYNRILILIREKGLSTTLLQKTPQNCDNPE
jgi:apolipoprotein D and lipocalin family protein